LILTCIPLVMAERSCEEIKRECQRKAFMSRNPLSPPLYCTSVSCPASYATSKSDTSFPKRCVDAHNEKRTQAFKGYYGADMLEMSWDDELATAAMKNALWNCAKGGLNHDGCHITPTYDSVGQNLISYGTSGQNASLSCEDAVNGWYKEFKNVKLSQIDSFSSYRELTIGHYTQVMWAKSYKVGCAYVKYRFNGLNRIVLACNYVDAGNVLTTPVFKRGALASACPTGSTVNPATKLCKLN